MHFKIHYLDAVEVFQQDNLRQTLTHLLREMGTTACLEKAEILEVASTHLTSLHFRSLGLGSTEVISIAETLQQGIQGTDHSIVSVSFSYNSQMGDLGAAALAKHLPHSLQEIGLVDCGIGDVGGLALLDWIKKSQQLRMVCLEQNYFSPELSAQFRLLSEEIDHLTLIV